MLLCSLMHQTGAGGSSRKSEYPILLHQFLPDDLEANASVDLSRQISMGHGFNIQKALAQTLSWQQAYFNFGQMENFQFDKGHVTGLCQNEICAVMSPLASRSDQNKLHLELCYCWKYLMGKQSRVSSRTLPPLLGLSPGNLPHLGDTLGQQLIPSGQYPALSGQQMELSQFQQLHVKDILVGPYF